ncbi:hypothetical protein D3C81_1918060 [compost metagenome]
MLDDFVAVGDRVVVGFGNAAGLTDFRHYTVSGRSVGAFTLGRAAEIVDQHFGALFGEQQRVGPSQATTGTGDDHDFIFETHRLIHGGTPAGQGTMGLSVRHGAAGHNEQGQG